MVQTSKRKYKHRAEKLKGKEPPKDDGALSLLQQITETSRSRSTSRVPALFVLK